MKRKMVLALVMAALLTFCGCGFFSDFEKKISQEESQEESVIDMTEDSSEEESKIEYTITEGYLASDEPTVMIFNRSDSGSFNPCDEASRGTVVENLNVTIDDAGDQFTMIRLQGAECYVLSVNLTDDLSKAVQEEQVYVRTSTTVYQNSEDAKIETYAPKGQALKVLSFDELDEDGEVRMYNVETEDGETGWVYSKYVVMTEKEANEVYDSDGIGKIHEDRESDDGKGYGGYAKNLDYYPVEKEIFEDNPIEEDARTMYLNAESIYYVDEFLAVAEECGINAIVLDIKDGQLAFPAETAKELSPTAYNNAYATYDDYAEAVARFKEAGLYVIGRIVTFNDADYAADHPEACIEETITDETWLSAYSRDAWYYNVALALESIDSFGFNEIQFDYLRFPDYSDEMSADPNTDFKNTYNEDKSEAIQNFLFYACDKIHEKNVYVSADVFGIAAYTAVTPQGQYWPAISNVVDVISAMPYVDHFGTGTDLWSEPYMTIYAWAKSAAARQTEIETPAIVRTWITAYDTPYWDPVVEYGEEKIEDQACALYDAGLTGGFITWNAGSSIARYRQIGEAWSKDYANMEPRTIAQEDIPSTTPGQGTGIADETEETSSSTHHSGSSATYTVQEGDSYYGILIDYYGEFSYDLLAAFCAYNDVSEDVLHVGDVLEIPPIDTLQ